MKKKTITFCIICFLSVHYLFAGNPVTRYYKQVKIVSKDRKEQTGNGRGQFITFTDKGCYDSDKSGYTVNNGFLKFGKSTTERVYYSGDSYWREAMYIFTENYNRLNIVVEDSGVTYVYELATPPANVTTCALIKGKELPPTPTPMPYPTPPTPNPTPNPTPSKETTCKGCSGTGKCTMCYSAKNNTCSVCFGKGYTNSGRCAGCNGDGKNICPGCRGSGNCKVCYGSGKIR